VPEEKLVGGDVTEDVVRVCDVVRRPLNAQSAAIHANLRDRIMQRVPQTFAKSKIGYAISHFIKTAGKVDPIGTSIDPMVSKPDAR
jgi:hypothetical protein